MDARRQPLPAVQVDADEYRLEKEAQGFDGEAKAESRAVLPHHSRPQDSEFKREDGAGHRADGELNGHHHGPAPRDLDRGWVFAENADRLHQQGQRGKRHSQRHEQHVARERECHLDAAG